MTGSNSWPDLSPLLNPRAIAVVGASERWGSAGRIVLDNLHHLEYQGAVHAVHPRHEQVLGYPCYPGLKALPGPVDSVAVLLGAERVLPQLEMAVEVGARAAWVLASGFAKAGAEGEAHLLKKSGKNVDFHNQGRLTQKSLRRQAKNHDKN